MLRHERYFVQGDYRVIAGVDESGCGCLAGPVIAGAVVLPEKARIINLNDSKKLNSEERTEVLEYICDYALAIGVGIATAEEIDKINIRQAAILAAERAIKALPIQPDFLVTDGLLYPALNIPYNSIVRGDSTCRAIAAASIVAKVFRDRIMNAYHQEYPAYAFAEHKGYATKTHIKAIENYGASTIHRLSFHGVAWFNQELVYSTTYQMFIQRMSKEDYAISDALDIEAEVANLCHFLPSREIVTLRQFMKSRNLVSDTSGSDGETKQL